MAVKRLELKNVFEKVGNDFSSESLHVGILGCGDKRFIRGHKKLLEGLVQKKIDLTTFDITVEHLAGEEGVVQHDVTEPLPGGPFDLIIGHVLLKFIPTQKQWDVVKNAYDALYQSGLAIFVQGKQELEYSDRVENYKAHDAYQYKPGQLNPVLINDLKKKLTEAAIEFINWESSIEGIEDVPIVANILVLKK